MVRQKVKEPKVDGELIYAYEKIDRLGEIEEFILMPNVANLQNVGDRLFDETLYEAAKIILAFISNWAKLTVTLARLKQFQGAVDAARKANSDKTWKEVDDLEEVRKYYQNRGCFNELISLMESGLGLERVHTWLGVLYARYRPEKLMEHIKLFSTRLNIPKLIRACDEQKHLKELTYLYIQYEEFDNAATSVMNHSPEAWDHMQFKDIAVKVANVELYYKAVHFCLQEHPDLINDMLNVLALRVDHTRVVDIMRKAGHLRLVKPYMVAVQSNNVSAVNEALNGIYIGLAQKVKYCCSYIFIEKHELLEMRRDKIYKDAMETASQSGDRELAEELLVYFIEQGKKECFASCLCVCYDLIRADVVLELAWINDMIDFAFPYLLQILLHSEISVGTLFESALFQFIRECTGKVDELIKDKIETQKEVKAKEQEEKEVIAQQNMYAQLLPLALPAPPMPGMRGGFAPPPPMGGMGMPPMPPFGMPPMGSYKVSRYQVWLYILVRGIHVAMREKGKDIVVQLGEVLGVFRSFFPPFLFDQVGMMLFNESGAICAVVLYLLKEEGIFGEKATDNDWILLSNYKMMFSWMRRRPRTMLLNFYSQMVIDPFYFTLQNQKETSNHQNFSYWQSAVAAGYNRRKL
ncbi:hypothetical protein CXB51_010606 [Gossypium anomalum]|uniref:Clathrin heavy chain n=1 Tax=Gossypium anomalum TaxID=47600 RepID=A0A8J6CZJ4_9ROSI|nr:hypothetical protein CXB51_010606 [Gossypium anomalum]